MGLGAPEILILVVVVFLLFFGGKKLPELAKGLGRSAKEFKKGLSDADEEKAKDKEKENN